MENWFKERLGPKARFDQVVKQLPQWSEQLPEMPNLVYRVMHDAANGNLQMQSHSQELKQLKRQVQLNQQRTVSAIFGASLIISATVSLGLNDLNLALWAGYPILSWVLGGLGLVCLIRAGS
jgi:ubiquinone biosynthesis protein